CLVDRLMADTQAEDQPTAGDLGGQCRSLRTEIGGAQIDMGDPGADLEPMGGQAHQQYGRHRVVVDFGAKRRLEAGILRGPRDVLYLAGAPPRSRDEAEPQPFRHPLPRLRRPLQSRGAGASIKLDEQIDTCYVSNGG